MRPAVLAWSAPVAAALVSTGGDAAAHAAGVSAIVGSLVAGAAFATAGFLLGRGAAQSAGRPYPSIGPIALGAVLYAALTIVWTRLALQAPVAAALGTVAAALNGALATACALLGRARGARTRSRRA